MRFVFLGCTTFSLGVLENLISIGQIPSLIFGIPATFNISYSQKEVVNSNYADLSTIAIKYNIPYQVINSVKGKRLTDFHDLIRSVNPDVILVMGWYYMLKKQTRELAKFGAWGIHASLLPNYAGGAPLVWAIINGEKETGVTLFRMDDGVDDGDIIAQSKFDITDLDDIRTVYQKALEASNKILEEVMLKNEPPSFSPQDKSAIKIFRQRNPQEGEIDWSWDAKKIKNFIRAQTKPYPGAWTVISGKKITLWSADIEEL